MKKIIAISGLKNSGKDTAAEMLQYCLSIPKIFKSYFWFKILKQIPFKKIRLVSFAGTLKEMLSVLLNVDVKRFEDRDFKENYYVFFPDLILTNNPKNTLSDKKFSTLISKDSIEEVTGKYYLSIRQVMQFFGTECMRKYFGDALWVNTTLNKIKDNDCIISDLRFKIEANSIKKHNGKIIYVYRDKSSIGNHSSEKEVKDMLKENYYDFVIDNSFNKKDLFNQIKNLNL